MLPHRAERRTRSRRFSGATNSLKQDLWTLVRVNDKVSASRLIGSYRVEPDEPRSRVVLAGRLNHYMLLTFRKRMADHDRVESFVAAQPNRFDGVARA